MLPILSKSLEQTQVKHTLHRHINKQRQLELKTSEASQYHSAKHFDK